MLNPRHPDTYDVQVGDTLWDIASTFLRDPWYWPEIWQINPQVENPHLIYPGDVLSLAYLNDGRPVIHGRARPVRGRRTTERLSPRIRELPLEEAIPTIPYETLAAFLTRRWCSTKSRSRTRRRTSFAQREGLIGSVGRDVYARGTDAAVGSVFNVVHVGDELVDPDDDDVLGYRASTSDKAASTAAAIPSTVCLLDGNAQDADRRLLLERGERRRRSISCRARPEQDVEGRIISVIDGVSLIGQYQVVVINRGASNGLEPGHVLARVPDRPSGSGRSARTWRVWRESALAGRAGGNDDGVPHVRPDELCTRHGSHQRDRSARHRPQPVTNDFPPAQQSAAAAMAHEAWLTLLHAAQSMRRDWPKLQALRLAGGDHRANPRVRSPRTACTTTRSLGSNRPTARCSIAGAWLSHPNRMLVTLGTRAVSAVARSARQEAPLALWVEGKDAASMLAAPQLAIVGSRNPTIGGTRHRRAICAVLERARAHDHERARSRHRRREPPRRAGRSRRNDRRSRRRARRDLSPRARATRARGCRARLARLGVRPASGLRSFTFRNATGSSRGSRSARSSSRRRGAADR